MDFIESLGKQLSEVTMYDVKSTFEKAKAMVLNYTEMEAKVHEATNGDAWGASSTLMQEIAAGTFNFQLFNEIMPVIYKRFTEKEARDWRQIYKALQLLEYLVKHGSERVVDDARSHLSMIKMLRNFHYVDEKGKDQGINVRNRSKELAELLSDLDRVRQERKKAKINKNKYGGVGNDGMSHGGGGGMSFTTASGSRYGGFGSDSLGTGGSSSSYPDSSYPSSSTRSTRRDSFEEYDAGDDDDRIPPVSSISSRSGGRRPSAAAPAPIKKDTPVIPQQAKKEVNLFDFDDDEPLAAAAPVAASGGAPRKTSFDDDFDDFQAAPSTTSAPAAPKPAAPASANFFDMMSPSSSSSAAPAQPQMRTSHFMPAGPSYVSNGSMQSQVRPGMGASHTSTPSLSGTGGMLQPSSSMGSMSRPMSASPAAAPAAAKKAGAFDFDDLFAASGAKSKAGDASAPGSNSMASLAAQKGSAQIWGSTGSSSAQSAQKNGNSNNLDDLLF